MSDTTSTQALTSSDTLADETAAEPKEAAVIVDHVKMSFNMANEQLNSLKEYFIKALRHELFFKEFIALNDVSFTVYKGDVYGIVGTNGSGKSTILKIIAGVLDPTTGTCTVNGSIAPLIELGAGFDLELTARENIYLNGALLGYSHDYIDEHFDEIVEFAELEEFLDLPMKNYSSGMVARIAFAIATIIVPDILIVDEALAVGDVFFQQKCERRINSLISDHGTTVLFVSHSIEQVERICQKAIWIEKGRKLMEGSVGEVCLAYRNMEYIDYTNVHGIMPAEEDQSQDPYEELTYVDLARAFWNCVSVSSSEEEQTAPFLFGWMLRSIAPPEAVDLIGDDPNGLARRDAAAVLVHSFALHRRPTAGEYEPTALGPYADAGDAAPCTVEALTWAVDHHLMAGVKDEQGRNIIRPDKPISRIQFAKMLTIMFREQLGYPEDISPGESFVRSGSYDYAINHSLMGGYASGQFGPHDVTTRGQALTVLWRAAGEPVPTSIPAFNDVHEGDYFASAVAWAIEQGLMEKTGDSFKPDDMIRRSDFLSILSKYEQLQGIQNLDEEIEAALAEDVIDTRDLMQRFGAAWDPNEGVSRALLAHAARLIHSNQMERESQSNTQDSLTS